MNTITQPEIEARKGIDFGLDESMPKYWHSNDPFKTRIHDALQLTFPEGERYFISSVRAFRKQINDEKLLHDVKEFTMQEAQHGIAHTLYNNLLEKQGMPVKRMLEKQKNDIKDDEAKLSPEFNLAITAAAEHYTALLADTYFVRKKTTEGMHPNMKALFAWHAIEEMEHRSVAFDVMTKVAKVGYFTRARAMVRATWTISYYMFHFADQMLEADGFSQWQRRKMFFKNLNWMYGPKGILSSFTPKLLMYFKPNFHPKIFQLFITIRIGSKRMMSPAIHIRPVMRCWQPLISKNKIIHNKKFRNVCLRSFLFLLTTYFQYVCYQTE